MTRSWFYFQFHHLIFWIIYKQTCLPTRGVYFVHDTKHSLSSEVDDFIMNCDVNLHIQKILSLFMVSFKEMYESPCKMILCSRIRISIEGGMFLDLKSVVLKFLSKLGSMGIWGQNSYPWVAVAKSNIIILHNVENLTFYTILYVIQNFNQLYHIQNSNSIIFVLNYF